MASQSPATADPSKKRKSDEINCESPSAIHPLLTPAVVRAVLDLLTKDQLAEILQSAAIRHPSILADIRFTADPDLAKRKLFVRGLGLDTSSESLRSAFTSFGEIVEAVAVVDKATGKPRGFGFVVFRHVDGALLALQEPSKKIDGRMTVTLLASAGNSSTTPDVSTRKIYVGNIPSDVSAEVLLAHFMSYGDIEEGPLGFDYMAGKPKKFAFFIYKTEEGARASLVDPHKTIGGQLVFCKLAVNGKREKLNGGEDGFGYNVPPPNPIRGNNGGPNVPPSYLNSGPNGQGFQPQPFYCGGAYEGGFGGYSGWHYGGPPAPVRMPSGGYVEDGNFGPRAPPPGGMYPGMPPYY